MGITGLGTAYLDNYRLAAPENAVTQNAGDYVSRMNGEAGGGQNFDALLNSAPASPKKADALDKNDKLYQLCLELETFLVKNLLNSMRSTVQKSGLIDEGFAGKMYEDMLYDEYAKDVTKNANFGLAEQAYRQLKTSALFQN